MGESLISRDLEIQNNNKADADPTKLDAQAISVAAQQEASRMNPNGDATVQAKITADGKLGRIEVIDGGTGYEDSDSPILLTFSPSSIAWRRGCQ